MSKLPPTPPKPPPMASSISPSPSSLPPRPPPSQVSFRKSTPIVPALPMGPLLQKKQFPPQGIGRGHSSLPPKPAFPGKPLPRDTDAVVLTPGDGEGPVFNQSFKQKRTYSTVASEPSMRPMDPAVTNLTPGNTISPSAHAIPQHTVPQTITPPAETSAAKNLTQMRPEPEINPTPGPNVSRGPKQRTPHQQMNGFVDSPRRHMEPQQTFRPEHHPIQVNHDHHQNNSGNMNNYQANHGGPQPDMYHHMGPQFGMHHVPPPPYPPPHQPGFFHQHPYHGGTLTPPNSGSMFMPPPIPPHIDNVMYSGEILGNGMDGNMNQHRSFSPLSGFQPNDPRGLQNFPPPQGPLMSSHASLRSQPHPEITRNIQERVPAVVEKTNGVNPALREICFVAPEENDKAVSDKTKGESAVDAVNELRPPSVKINNIQPSPIGKLESYMLHHFLNDSIADVSIVLKNPATRRLMSFPAHSFVLCRSTKLFRMLDSTRGTPPLRDMHSNTASWADDFDTDYPEPIRTTFSPQHRKTTITISALLDHDAFIVALRTLYGAPDWTLDAFLDPDHPSHHQPGIDRDAVSKLLSPPGISPQVAMLEKSIGLFSVGIVLGLEDVIHKAICGITRWGMSFEGEGFERLLKFLLYDVHQMKNDKVLESHHWDFAGPLLRNAIACLAQNLGGFKIDFRAPSSKYLIRINQVSPGSSGRNSPLNSLTGQLPKSLRRIHSTILLSLPFEILKSVLEHDSLASEGKKQRFDLATSVIQERERRRRREIKALQESGDKKLDDEEKKSESTNLADVKVDSETEVLFWEESVVSTFGHGAIGIEVTKRRKGGPGGRMLWKVGRRGSNSPN
ncbi:hypothetical protein EDC01DRAFT_618981 [Geopyxis carbonaria]|nr:hypothetical protein EDC01DRAFT_618981 [Geopyxis carbonaria]